jgi:hypothetical protein
MVDTADAHGSDRAAFEAADQHASQGVAEGGGLTPLQGTDHEDPRLGTVVGNLVLDPIDLVLQHGLWWWGGGKGRAGFRPGGAWHDGNRCGAGG